MIECRRRKAEREWKWSVNCSGVGEKGGREGGMSWVGIWEEGKGLSMRCTSLKENFARS